MACGIGLMVSGGSGSTPAAAITEISWKGLRCNLEVSGGTAGMTADLRREAAGGHLWPPRLNRSTMAVLLSTGGQVIAQRRTVVGGEA
jgi:hypothetical protein